MLTSVKHIRERMVSELISTMISVVLRTIDDPENGSTVLG